MGRSGAGSELEPKIGYSFRNAKLLETALTHSSYANEREEGAAESNERLEFLGDAVTGLEVALLIYEKWPHLSEGQMTALRASLVRSEWLAKTARSLGLGRWLRLGVGANKTDIRENDAVLEDALEALIAAVFLDGGTEASRRVVRHIFGEAAEEKAKDFSDDELYADYKSRLQVELQKNGAADIRYKLLEESGPGHDRNFRASVTLGGRVLGIGEGKSKKLAEKMAAKKALEDIGCI